MRALKGLVLIVVVCAAPLVAQDQQSPGALDQAVTRIIARENQEMVMIRGYSPLVETYIQKENNKKNNGGAGNPPGTATLLAARSSPRVSTLKLSRRGTTTRGGMCSPG